jgi:hypothetical protein
VCHTGLTGVEPLSGSRQVPPAGTGLTGVCQWTRGLVFRYVLGSEGCVLVPRSSGTPVATWAWPIWVVSRRRVLEVVFILLEFPSPSRRIFIGSHSLPPSLVRRIGSSDPCNELIQLFHSSCGGGFLVNGVSRMIGCGGRPRRELLTDREGLGQRRAEPPQKVPRPTRTGRPAQALSRPVQARLPRHGSSWHFGLSPLDLCHFEVIIPAIKIGGLLA